MKRYCIDCGSPTEFSLRKPLYCSNCGKPFDKVSPLNKASNIFSSKNDEVVLVENDDEDELDSSGPVGHLNINNIEVDVDLPKVKKESIKSIIGTEKPDRKPNKKNKNIKSKPKLISDKDFLSEFSKEAGSIRKKK